MDPFKEIKLEDLNELLNDKKKPKKHKFKLPQFFKDFFSIFIPILSIYGVIAIVLFCI
tara:strand:- start:112 stop:285 length:174 start_codon:yes stop_codon:yes gene_type:complete